MLPRPSRQQKIQITCLVEHDGKILLLRGSEYLDQASQNKSGYFGLPGFTLTFGSDPRSLLTQELQEQFGQIVDTINLLDAQQKLTSPASQIVNLVYHVTVQDAQQEQDGRFFFSSIDQLDDFLFPAELASLRFYLKNLI